MKDPGELAREVESLRQHVNSQLLMVSKLFADWDHNGDGKVDREEFHRSSHA